MPISLPFLAELLATVLAVALLVHAANRALRWFIDRAPTAPEYDVKFDVDPLAPESFVDAHETLLPLEDAEQIRCAFCGAPLSSLTRDHCWVCESPNDRSAA